MQHWVRTVFEDLLWANRDASDETRIATNRIISAIEAQDVHLFRNEELEQVADGLSECADLDELSEWMWKATTKLRFQGFAIFVVKPAPGVSFKSKICTSYSEEWIARYVDQGYQFIDPVIAEASQGDGCFCYADLDGSSPTAEAFWADAAAHKVGRNGVCCAFTRAEGSRLGVSFSSKGTAETVEEITRQYGSDIVCLAQLAGEAFCYSVAGPYLPDDTLTREELRFLSILSTSSNPQDALKLSSCFGSNDALQASIRRKLGVQTVFQAVAVASSRGWFDQLPFDSNDIVRPFARLDGLQSEGKAVS